MDFLFGFGLEQNGIFINVLVLLFSFISCYIMTPLELVFSHLLMICFWCLGSLRLYLYLRRVRLYCQQYVGVDTTGRGRMGLCSGAQIHLLFHSFKTALVLSRIIYLSVIHSRPQSALNTPRYL